MRPCRERSASSDEALGSASFDQVAPKKIFYFASRSHILHYDLAIWPAGLIYQIDSTGSREFWFPK